MRWGKASSVVSPNDSLAQYVPRALGLGLAVGEEHAQHGHQARLALRVLNRLVRLADAAPMTVRLNRAMTEMRVQLKWN